jgi:cytosine/adenosine deaminase-related metal-dependent hydrolase
MIFRARIVVTMDGPPIENGAVVVEGDRIVDVGTFAEIKARNSNEVVDLGEQTLLPGLINAHCHLDYSCLRRMIPPQESFTDWIRAINAAKAKLAPGDYLKSVAAGFAEAQKFGTTSIVNYEAFPELVGRMPAPIRTWWLAELIDVRNPHLPEQIVDLAMLSISPMENQGLAPHAPFTASLDLYRLCQETGRRHDLPLSTHLAESREEMLMFRDATGPLYDFMEKIGRDMRDCGQGTPLEYLMRHAALDERWLIVHLNELAESDFDLLARATTKFHVVHCPRSHSYFEHSPFPFQSLDALGFNICLGTDSLASNDDLSLFAEMRELRLNEPTLAPERILEMVTVNPARALGRQSALGRIKPGFPADMIALPFEGKGDPFDEIIAFRKAVSWAMVDGQARVVE